MELRKKSVPSYPYLTVQYLQKWHEWHQEDAWRVSQTYPIYAIADGVTQKIYLNLTPPLGPKVVAEIFCAETIRRLEDFYSHCLSKRILAEAFAVANQAIAKHNNKTDNPGVTVGAAVVIKRGRLYGARAADCGFAVLRGGQLFFKTPEFWSANKLSGRDNYARLDGQFPVVDYLDFFSFPSRLIPRQLAA